MLALFTDISSRGAMHSYLIHLFEIARNPCWLHKLHLQRCSTADATTWSLFTAAALLCFIKKAVNRMVFCHVRQMPRMSSNPPNPKARSHSLTDCPLIIPNLASRSGCSCIGSGSKVCCCSIHLGRVCFPTIRIWRRPESEIRGRGLSNPWSSFN